MASEGIGVGLRARFAARGVTVSVLRAWFEDGTLPMVSVQSGQPANVRVRIEVRGQWRAKGLLVPLVPFWTAIQDARLSRKTIVGFVPAVRGEATAFRAYWDVRNDRVVIQRCHPAFARAVAELF